MFAGCATAPLESVNALLPMSDGGIAKSKIRVDAAHFDFGDYSSSAWTSDRFSGDYARQFYDETLVFGVKQSAPEGGLDIGVTRADYAPGTVAQMNPAARICSTYDMNLTGVGRW